MKSPYHLDHLILTEKLGKTVGEDSFASGRVLFDGVFKGDYSLAVVNRQLARALIRAGVQVDLYSSEQDWENDAMLLSMPDVRGKMISQPPPKGRYDTHLRNTWPPRADDMVGRFNAYVCFAWEEMDFPYQWVDEFNRHLDAVLVTANYVRQSFLHSGIDIPVHVVGNGCDHVLESELNSAPRKDAQIRTFLHVSSCFPRKGADLLVEAFSRTFSSDENIELLIKTFANPHNTVAHDIAQARERHPNCAPIRLIEASLPDAELKALYANAVALVAPSRGEGFGLPFAEAMLLNVPVITTGYSGQTDFCTPETAWLVDYSLVPSQAHVAGAFSLWAEPSVESLGQKMRAVIDQPAEARARTVQAKKLLNAHLTWSAVARRVVTALALEGRAKEISNKTASDTARIDVVSTWQQQCGIATYCESLMGTPVFSERLGRVFSRTYASDHVSESVAASAPPALEVNRLWGYDFVGIQRLGQALVNASNPVVWFQHHPGFFSPGDMQYLCTQLAKSRYRTKIITLHNVKEVVREDARWLDKFDLVFVHTAEDGRMLSRKGVREPVVLPHGIPDIASSAQSASNGSFTVGAFGFLYPHKNIPMLVQAVAFARRYSTRIRLLLLNCAKPDDVSRLEQSRVITLIRMLKAEDYIEIDFRFLDESEIIERLAQCDLIAFPYGESPESATGAARIALAANCPLLISRSGVLDDLQGYGHRLRNLETSVLAEGLLSLAANPELLHLFDAERLQFTQRFAYTSVAKRYAANIKMALERLA